MNDFLNEQLLMIKRESVQIVGMVDHGISPEINK